MKRAILAITAVLSFAIAGCSSAEDGGTEPGTRQAPDAVAATDATGAAAGDTDGAEPDNAAAGSEAKGEVDAATGPICGILVTLHQDITALPERVENEGVTDADIDVIIGPAEAVKQDLPGLAGTVLPILKNDVRAASVMKTAAEVEEYFARGTHDTAIEELVKSTRTACGLPDSWPEGA